MHPVEKILGEDVDKEEKVEKAVLSSGEFFLRRRKMGFKDRTDYLNRRWPTRTR